MNERIKPMIPLSREDRIIKKNSLVFISLYKLITVLSGEGKIIAELIIKDINFQIIIKDIIEINVNRPSFLVVEIFIRYFSSYIFRREFQQDFDIILDTFFCRIRICKFYIASGYGFPGGPSIHSDFEFFDKQ
jgi:hypothetical protein